MPTTHAMLEAKIVSLRAELDGSLRDYFRSQQEIDRLRAAASRDTETIVRLREAVKTRDDLLKEIRPEVSEHCYAWFEERRAALAHLPQEEPSQGSGA